ncbi:MULTISPECIES: carbamoyltransferase C-terminal domain-containing protein [Mesorhizobium]|uniref:Carbamoyltransferase C-terminal domain-containing protein n=1 Tax=Mesorhizobium robiniae TaxID=559315 RepID=A0ABV2GZB8_9HYPH|nr:MULTISPECIES: carbamoyltransferase C-terminal domain-containing protein [Mesorhizobium]MCV3242149.1 hypothetical protein [Mesorhizobium sp. ZC-5]
MRNQATGARQPVNTRGAFRLAKATHERLNRIQNREGFRPIAPVCLEGDVGLHFDLARPSPYMLLFHRVLDSRLRAVTHVDGTARVQTVSQEQKHLFQLLNSFKAKSGAGGLCNTSLNFNGGGFINHACKRLAGLCPGIRPRQIAINDAFYLLKEAAPTSSSGRRKTVKRGKNIPPSCRGKWVIAV